MIDVQFEVPLEPRGYTRARVGPGKGGKPVHFKASADRATQGAIALAASQVMPRGQISVPVRVDILAVFQRPKRLIGRKHLPGMVWCPKTPDTDNIEKNVLDSLKAFWVDDKLVCAGEVVKVYHEQDGRPRMVVRIRELAEDPCPVIESLFARVVQLEEPRSAQVAGSSPAPGMGAPEFGDYCSGRVGCVSALPAESEGRS